jgi:hypothetical protein
MDACTPKATSDYLNQPIRTREEYLAEKARRIREWRDYIEANPDPVLKGSAAISTTWIFHKQMLERQGK